MLEICSSSFNLLSIVLLLYQVISLLILTHTTVVQILFQKLSKDIDQSLHLSSFFQHFFRTFS